MSKASELYDSKEFKFYTGRMELDKAIYTLRGLLEGMVIDGKVTNDEVLELSNWLSINEPLAKYYPFVEIYPIIKNILSDGIVDDE